MLLASRVVLGGFLGGHLWCLLPYSSCREHVEGAQRMLAKCCISSGSRLRSAARPCWLATGQLLLPALLCVCGSRWPLWGVLSEHLQGSGSGYGRNVENRSQGITADPGWPSLSDSLSPPGDRCLHSTRGRLCVSRSLCVWVKRLTFHFCFIVL